MFVNMSHAYGNGVPNWTILELLSPTDFRSKMSVRCSVIRDVVMSLSTVICAINAKLLRLKT